MKTPTWAIFIGICLIFFGGCSVMKNTQAIYMPDMLDLQENMLKEMSSPESTAWDSLANASKQDSTMPVTVNPEAFKKMAKSMDKMFAVSDFSKAWTVRFGYIGLFVSLIYILSGIFLFVKKSFSIQLVYIALIISLLFSIIQPLVIASGSSEESIMTIASGVGNIPGIIIDIILLLVVFAMDKSAYTMNKEEVA